MSCCFRMRILRNDPQHSIPRCQANTLPTRACSFANRNALDLFRDHWREPDLSAWARFADTYQHASKVAVIGIVGKYVELKESYKSLNEALAHGAVANGARVELRHLDAEELETGDADKVLAGIDAILVPGGFGRRGTEGKIRAVQYAREKGMPFFGICLGMQIAVIEFARNVCKLEGAHSTEFAKETPYPVVDLMETQREVTQKGGSMRLGACDCVLQEGSLAQKVYGKKVISERHRHRFEVNNQYRAQLEAAGLRLSGLSPDGKLVEMCELPGHPWFLACQFHPEYKSRPLQPHPMFTAFIGAALVHQSGAKSKK